MTDISKLSVVIPARNEADNLATCLKLLREELVNHQINHEILVINDNSTDNTATVVEKLSESWPEIKLITRQPPGGFGRAVRCGLQQFTGDAVVIYMADLSDDPADVVSYYEKLREGYDCVFGSRFIKGGKHEGYPIYKLILNRIANNIIRVLFRIKYNDTTNAFKAYRRYVIENCGPYKSCHFNITLEIPLNALICGYNYAVVPIAWSGRTAGVSRFKIGTMSRRYLSTLLKCFFDNILVRDDLEQDRISGQPLPADDDSLKTKLDTLEQRLADLEQKVSNGEKP